MNALTAVHNNAVDSGQDYSGFTLIPSAQSPRLLELTFTEQTTNSFSNRLPNGPCRRWSTNRFCVFG
ncbi:Protein CsiD [Escherichia coli]|uniref:Protein CsiD n=1 Tax=Escherichia coli TaxID=562 RepID=A0A376TV01_ECOLX|nr:Protein CsiD [Escherichia coli]